MEGGEGEGKGQTFKGKENYMYLNGQENFRIDGKVDN